MKLMRLAMCVAVFAVVGGIATSEDLNVQALKAQLAAQEARLNDLQAKMNSRSGGSDEAKGIVSLRKNAVVTLGGTVNTRYFYRQGNVKSKMQDLATGAVPTPNPAVNNNMQKREDFRHGDMRIADAKVEMKIDVNEYFDAYLKMDLHDGAGRDSVSGIAQNYWVRWKNVCNSGFGLLVGRDALKYGDNQPIGILDSWNKDNGGMTADITGNSNFWRLDRDPDGNIPANLGMGTGGSKGNGMFAFGSMSPAHTTYNWTRTTQLNPYWESQDGKLRAEVSFIQSIDRRNGTTGIGSRRATNDSVRHFRTINYGVGSMTARLVWKPIEGLKLTASAMNLHANNSEFRQTFGPEGRQGGFNNYNGFLNNAVNGNEIRGDKNNSSVNLAFQYRPCFFNRLNVWGQWTHGWNEAWVKNQDADSANFGFSFDINDQWTFFAQGDLVRTKNDQSIAWNKATGWATYTGIRYVLPYGVNLEAGWRHEQIKYKGKASQFGNQYAGTHTKYKGDTIYAHLGFNF